ncbi:MAG TPA: DUF5655 domain-containing protein [Pyrinomonadaceae bacterium]|jgi:uncharacterized protein DUF5655|nr:DUF5655 domain-containing protein [Pyrinomonadaceae bacterium]
MPGTAKKLPPLWRCPECGRGFANRNQSHSCSDISLQAHFTGKSEHVRKLFDALVARIKKCGPVKVLPEKTRIAFQMRMSFIAVQVRRNYLIGHFVFARRVESPRFLRVETFSPRNHLHAFRLNSLAELDDEFATWIREAYAVGEQKHLRRRSE